MQQNIRKKVLGKKFWQKKRDQRIVWGNRSGKVLTLYDLLGDDEEVITQITDSKVGVIIHILPLHRITIIF